MNFNPIQNIYMYFFNEEDILSKVWHKMASQKLKIGMELDLGEETEYCPCWRQTSKEEGQFDHHQDQHQGRVTPPNWMNLENFQTAFYYPVPSFSENYITIFF